MFPVKALLLVHGVLGLTACAVSPPTSPAVLALPTEGKDLVRFQQEDTSCRGYAQQQIGYGSSQQAANQNALGSAAVGTAIGAAPVQLSAPQLVLLEQEPQSERGQAS